MTVFMILAICLPTYIVKCLPASSVTTVSANVGTGFPTTLTAGSATLDTTRGTMAGMPQGKAFTAVGYSDSVFMVFDRYASLLIEVYPGYTNCRAAVLKDPLKLLIGYETSTTLLYYTLSVNAGGYTATPATSVNTMRCFGRLLDYSTTSHYFMYAPDYTNKFDIATGYVAVPDTYVSGLHVERSQIMTSLNVVFGCHMGIDTPGGVWVIDRTNFQVINNPTSTLATTYCVLDNLLEDSVYVYNKPAEVSMNMASLTASTTTLVVGQSQRIVYGYSRVND